MKYLLSVIVFVTLNVLVRSQNGGIVVKIKQYGPIKAEMGDQVNLTCITNFNFTYSQGSFEGCRWINTRFDAKEQCEMDQNTYGSDFNYCMRWKQKQYTCLVSCQQRFITSTLVNRIEVHPRLLILMKKFPDFPIARPLFYSVLLMLSDAASGWAGWTLAHTDFGSSVNPIITRGADYAHHITASPPGFENPAASL